jgi:hypothetical protein
LHRSEKLSQALDRFAETLKGFDCAFAKGEPVGFGPRIGARFEGFAPGFGRDGGEGSVKGLAGRDRFGPVASIGRGVSTFDELARRPAIDDEAPIGSSSRPRYAEAIAFEPFEEEGRMFFVRESDGLEDERTRSKRSSLAPRELGQGGATGAKGCEDG